jgi:hypothetical protein
MAEAGDHKRSFRPELAGRRAECDGGGPVPGTHFAGRQDFAGTLTGDCIEYGDPAWRWFLMTDLVVKPEGFGADAVWCLEGNLYLIDEEQSGPQRPRDAARNRRSKP